MNGRKMGAGHSQELFAECIELASNQLSSIQRPTTTKEIENLHQLFFEHDWEEDAEKLSQDSNPRAPHVLYVIKSLYDCINCIRFPTFQQAVDQNTQLLQKDSLLTTYIGSTLEDRKAILEMENVSPDQERSEEDCKKFKEMVAQLKTDLTKFPVWTVKQRLLIPHTKLAYVLLGSDMKEKWIFKPDYQVEQEKIWALTPGSTDTSAKEVLAFVLNISKRFPIPATYLVEIKGYQGSVQLFVENARHANTIEPKDEKTNADLQSLLVFDLLFANRDRNNDNFLIREESEITRVYGIDNEACLKSTDEPIKVEYLQISSAFNQQFTDEVAELFSERSIDEYQNILSTFPNIRPNAKQWLAQAGRLFREGHINKKTALEIVTTIKRAFETSRNEDKENFGSHS